MLMNSLHRNCLIISRWNIKFRNFFMRASSLEHCQKSFMFLIESITISVDCMNLRDLIACKFWKLRHETCLLLHSPCLFRENRRSTLAFSILLLICFYFQRQYYWTKRPLYVFNSSNISIYFFFSSSLTHLSIVLNQPSNCHGIRWEQLNRFGSLLKMIEALVLSGYMWYLSSLDPW